MASRPTLSACIITLDEEERLPACLASLGFCDEVVVVDSESADRTVAIAEGAGARVVVNPWPGFAAQRNVALDAAAGDWILEIDADERIEPALATAIRAFLDDPVATEAHDLAMLPGRHVFLGRALSASMQAPSYRSRLFRRDRYRHDEGRTVHEGLWPNGPALPLDDGAMVHELAGSWGEALHDARAYARLEARQFHGAVGPVPALRAMAVRPPVKVAYRLLVDGGWRDGWQGAARIILEASADVLAWTYILRDPPATAVRDGVSRHLGATEERRGAGKVAGVAAGAAATRGVGAWLADAAAAGGEAVLVTDADVTAPPPGVRLRRAAPTPLGLARALDAEHQVRPLDGLVAAGPRVRARLRLARVHGLPWATADEAPAAALARLVALRP